MSDRSSQEPVLRQTTLTSDSWVICDFHHAASGKLLVHKFSWTFCENAREVTGTPFDKRPGLGAVREHLVAALEALNEA